MLLLITCDIFVLFFNNKVREELRQLTFKIKKLKMQVYWLYCKNVEMIKGERTDSVSFQCWFRASINEKERSKKGKLYKTRAKPNIWFMKMTTILDQQWPGFTTTASGSVDQQGASENWATVG